MLLTKDSKKLIEEYIPLWLVLAGTGAYKNEDTMRLRLCCTPSVCMIFSSLNDIRKPDGTQWLAPTVSEQNACRKIFFLGDVSVQSIRDGDYKILYPS